MFAYNPPIPRPFSPGTGNGRIYVLTDPDSMAVRYVGATFQKAHDRLQSHLSHQTGLPAVLRWVAEMGTRPLIMVVDRAASRPELHERERGWILHLRGLGADLLNAPWARREVA